MAILCNNLQQKEPSDIPTKIENAGSRRMDCSAPSRVEATPSPRVVTRLTTSNIPTCPRDLTLVLHVHQRQTRRNTPMPEVVEVKISPADPSVSTMPLHFPIVPATSNPLPYTILPLVPITHEKHHTYKDQQEHIQLTVSTSAANTTSALQHYRSESLPSLNS